MLWGGDEDIASIVADEPMERPMQKLNDLSRSPSPLDPNGTLIAVIELSLSSWLVAGIVPGVERQPLKKLAVDESALLKLLHRWREEAAKAGHRIKRIAVVFEAGRDGFWLARWLRARDIEAHVIHASSVAVSREHRRAKTDRLDTELLKRSFLGWLRGERDHCKMVAIPTIQDEDANPATQRRPLRIFPGERRRHMRLAALQMTIGAGGERRRHEGGALAVLRDEIVDDGKIAIALEAQIDDGVQAVVERRVVSVRKEFEEEPWRTVGSPTEKRLSRHGEVEVVVAESRQDDEIPGQGAALPVRCALINRGHHSAPRGLEVLGRRKSGLQSQRGFNPFGSGVSDC
ncbi:hypothetical protein IVB18_19695 [Bradyrhizobium sp. 186]|uniref:hypothetical protein n=1 Tax=Bradyrhizobium sp. 186 TaxID=2782654 RepID=UPI0020007C2B|nr:hypothetical protein [Bradyrhizobium sp. 186]UPK39262.1 hypothetical protein IVB18_19695 [Bradyrhizobium sp. 186]